MCGIAGIIGNNPEKSTLISKMIAVQYHRGPDMQKIWESPDCSLGHNRLSIIDLSEEASQPMVSSSGRFIIVFNGEIYNYKELRSLIKEAHFRTKSDTEVVLALFEQMGFKMLEHLNGMFSFLIWDKIEKKAFAARDRFGVKPFYYTLSDNVLYFSSEIKTLWAAGIEKKRNDKIWASYLVTGSYGMPDETFWNDIKQLPGGHCFSFTLNENELKIKKYYSFEDRIKNYNLVSQSEIKEKYVSLLEESVMFRFRSDVNVGFNISGGVDSSLLLALVNVVNKNRNENIEAFTFYCNDERYDEIPWVTELISKTGISLNKVLLEPSEIIYLAEKVAYYQDEPYGGIPTIAYSKIFQRARNKNIIVLLDGQGIDEAWAGYDYYQTGSGFTIQGVKSTPVRTEILKKEFLSLAVEENYPTPFNERMQNLQYRDFFYTKIPRALRFNDRISMMHSTELREPFLDYRLVEMAFAQPTDVKIRNGIGKWPVRQIVNDYLGDNIAYAPKRPLQTPQREWLGTELKDWVNDNLNFFSRLDFIDSKLVKKIWGDFQNGSNDNSFFLWQWINLTLILKI